MKAIKFAYRPLQQSLSTKAVKFNLLFPLQIRNRVSIKSKNFIFLQETTLNGRTKLIPERFWPLSKKEPKEWQMPSDSFSGAVLGRAQRRLLHRLTSWKRSSESLYLILWHITHRPEGNFGMSLAASSKGTTVNRTSRREKKRLDFVAKKAANPRQFFPSSPRGFASEEEEENAISGVLRKTFPNGGQKNRRR